MHIKKLGSVKKMCEKYNPSKNCKKKPQKLQKVVIDMNENNLRKYKQWN